MENLTGELADLLEFASLTALAIKMSIAREDPNRDDDILWLCSTLQNLELLTAAIKKGQAEVLGRTALRLENDFQRYIYPFRYPDSVPQSQVVFDKWCEFVDLHYAIDSFRRIAVKVIADIGLICVNCHHVYWPSEVEYHTPLNCEWRKTDHGEIYYLCPSCNTWTRERKVDIQDPATLGNLV